MSAGPTIRLAWEPTPESIEPIRKALRAYNEARVGNYSGKTLAAFATDEDDRLLGGMFGWLQRGWLTSIGPSSRSRRGGGASGASCCERWSGPRGRPASAGRA